MKNIQELIFYVYYLFAGDKYRSSLIVLKLEIIWSGTSRLGWIQGY